VTDPRVGLYDDDRFLAHDAGSGHPERPERLEAVRRGLGSAGITPRCVRTEARDASREELERVHAPDHVSRVAASAGKTVRFDPDTQAGPRSYEAALLAAGAVTDAVGQVLTGGLDRALCLVRPPGHHAESDRAMGFCLFNNVAVAAAAALARGVERVMIVDFDVHHGNGTQHLFEREPRVLYVSSHAYPFYPGTGALDEVGEGPGRGYTVNLPMPAGLGDVEYARVYREIVEPVGRAYDPELVIVSAGFDAYYRDPLAGMALTSAGYRELSEVCLRIASGAAGGRVVFALEGGYDLTGLSECSAEMAALALGGESPGPISGDTSRADELLAYYRRGLRDYWPALG
jgi:acetoin utilization deacetylase AcuC-like enzyme